MKAVSSDVLALRNMQQDKQQTANPPKTNNMKRTATNWMGTSRITAESIAAESTPCPNLTTAVDK